MGMMTIKVNGTTAPIKRVLFAAMVTLRYKIINP